MIWKPVSDARWTVAVLIILYVLSFADRQVISMLVGPIKADLQLSDFKMSLLMGLSFALLYAIVGLPMGFLADRFSRRPLIFFGVLIWALSACACGLARSFPALLVLRSGVGVGEAVLPASANSLIADKVPTGRLGFFLSMFATATSIGDALSFALGGLVLSLVAHVAVVHVPLFGNVRSWQMVFLLTGLPGLFLAPLVFTFREPRRQVRSVTSSSDMSFGRWLIAHRRLALCFAGSFCVMGIVAYAAAQWTPTYMSRAFNWTPHQFGLALGVLFPSAAIFGHLVCGPLVDRMFRGGRTDAAMIFMSRCLLLSAPLVVGSYLVSNPWLFLSGLLVTKSVMTPFLGYSMAALMAAVPSQLRARAASAYMLVLTLLGGVFGPSLIAGVAEFGFHDEAKLGWSLALVVTLSTFTALISIHLGRPALRNAIAEAAGNTSVQPDQPSLARHIAGGYH